MMHKKRLHEETMLINIYNAKAKELKFLSDHQVEELLQTKQKQHLQLAHNPNKFWYIKGMPLPKEIEPTTSKMYGGLVVLALFLVLIGFLVLFIVLAFVKNG